MNTNPHRLPAKQRVLLAVVGAAGIAVQLMAHTLEPDPRGFGTHEQLGLTPCYFQKSTGHVCPMCGATTAWAHIHRGQLMQAAIANLGATLLCAAVGIGAPWLLVVAAWGKWPLGRPPLKVLLTIAAVWLVVVVLDWLRRIYLGL